jgi:hypothetical protein
MLPLAIVTMTYNENRKLPYWLAHYAGEVGLRHCTIIDHGSTDGSTDRIGGANRLRLPRSPQDNDRRTAVITDIVAALLRHYARVAYVDVDELLVADPDRHTSLLDYADDLAADAVTAVGVEVVHGADEAPLDGWRGIGEQRGTGLFSSSMCKTSMVGRRVTWAPGFHAHDGPPRFDDLYLFHLRHADLGQALERLETTRAMAWAHAAAGSHQRGSSADMSDLVCRFGRRPLGQFDSLAGNCADFLAASTPPPAPGWPHAVPLAVYGRERFALPGRFRDALSRRPFT